MKVSLITPTRNRPEFFYLCQVWMERQTARRNIHRWYVCTDQEDDLRIDCSLPVHVIKRTTSTEYNPASSFNANYKALLQCAKEDDSELVLCIEDDDWYSENYIDVMLEYVARKPSALIYGEAHDRWYHIGNRWFTTMPNTQLASLAQTGFKKEVVDYALTYLKKNGRAVDLDGTLWRRSGITHENKYLVEVTSHHVGIKGGNEFAAGIAHGDNRNGQHFSWTWQDSDSYDELRHLVGGEDKDAIVTAYRNVLRRLAYENRDCGDDLQTGRFSV